MNLELGPRFAKIGFLYVFASQGRGSKKDKFSMTSFLNDPLFSKCFQFGLQKPGFPMMSGFMQSTTSPTVRRGGGLAAMQVGTFDDLPNNIFSAVKTPEIFKINREKNKNFMLRAMARY